MRDFLGNKISIGDTVAIIYHPEAYRFFLKSALIKEVKGKENMVICELIGTDKTAGFKPLKSSDLYPKIVKVNPEFPVCEPGTPIDAIGHTVKTGDRIICQRLPEAGGNTVKGFEKGGTVIKITEKYFFYTDDETGETRRKSRNRAVVC